MICFEVSLNGKEIARVGHPDAATLVAVLEATPSVQAIGLELTGELPPQDGNAVIASWGNHACHVGDELTIRVVDAAEAADPAVFVQGIGEVGSPAQGRVWPMCCLCGKSYHDVHSMVATERAHVCDSCIDALIELRRV
jgi:hypothetical protein